MTDDTGGDMTCADFTDLLDQWGPDLARWPEESAAHARVLLDRSAEAQDALREARALAAVLDKAPAGKVDAALTARVLAGAPGPAHAVEGTGGGPALDRWLGGWLRPAALMAASLVAGLYVGITAPASEVPDEQTDLLAYVFDVPSSWETGEWQ